MTKKMAKSKKFKIFCNFFENFISKTMLKKLKSLFTTMELKFQGLNKI